MPIETFELERNQSLYESIVVKAFVDAVSYRTGLSCIVRT